WNASGITFATDADGFKVRLESLAAILSGGVAFDTAKEQQGTAIAEDGQDYPLYEDQDAARAAGYSKHINLVTYFQGSVRGLSVGSPVELFGIRIGSVTAISLHLDPIAQQLGVAVHLEVQPERFKVDNARQDRDPTEVIPLLLREGLRTQLRSTSLLTGQLAVALDFFPDAPDVPVQMQGDSFVLPSQAGDIDSITRSVGDIAAKLNRLPLDKIGDALLSTLQSADALVASPELKGSLQSVAQAAGSLQTVMRKLDDGIGPTLKKLPELTASLQQATDRASKALGSINDGYGTNSDFHRSVQRLLGQMTDMTRAIRFLVEFLDEHPEALVRGRAEEGRNR
ncbi:MAG: MCE family protein, partial [Rhodospirillales bacterium]|nr:MCE family protein [Rhodospirillales bacterium]